MRADAGRAFSGTDEAAHGLQVLAVHRQHMVEPAQIIAGDLAGPAGEVKAAPRRGMAHALVGRPTHVPVTGAGGVHPEGMLQPLAGQ
jgi:hypothetical protein